MSEFFAYVCTRTTADPYLPPVSPDLRIFSRDVSDAFVAISGGFFRVGQITFYPIQRTVANSLLCDGSEVPRTSFPELYEYLGDTQGTPTDSDNFVLPNFLTTFVPATTADTETVVDGTVSSPGVGATQGPADSGGRIPRGLEDFE